jgi:hypothetical protein
VGRLLAISVDSTPETIRFAIVLMVLLLAGRGIYDLSKRSAARTRSVSSPDALTDRKAFPAAGYLIGIVVLLFLLWLEGHLEHMCASNSGANDFWGYCDR